MEKIFNSDHNSDYDKIRERPPSRPNNNILQNFYFHPEVLGNDFNS